MWALHTCGWKMLPWWLLWPEHSSEVRSGSIHRDNKIGRGEVKVEEVEIIALFQERNMRKLQSIHSYRQMASCPWRKKKKISSVCQERYILWNIHSAQVIIGVRVEKIIHWFFFLYKKAKMWMAGAGIHLNCCPKPRDQLLTSLMRFRSHSPCPQYHFHSSETTDTQVLSKPT